MPEGEFSLAFYPYSRTRGTASAKMLVKEHCRCRTRMPEEKLSIEADNLFFFNDQEGKPRTCYRILIRYMAFPNDGYKMHKINWL